MGSVLVLIIKLLKWKCSQMLKSHSFSVDLKKKLLIVDFKTPNPQISASENQAEGKESAWSLLPCVSE